VVIGCGEEVTLTIAELEGLLVGESVLLVVGKDKFVDHVATLSCECRSNAFFECLYEYTGQSWWVVAILVARLSSSSFIRPYPCRNVRVISSKVLTHQRQDLLTWIYSSEQVKMLNCWQFRKECGS